MPHADFPAGLTELLQRGWVRSYPAVELTFADDSHLYISTVPIEAGSITYDDYLSSFRGMKSTSTRSVDRCEFTIDNADLTIGDQLFDPAAEEELLHNVPAVYVQLYQSLDDPTEIYRVVKMSGMLYAFQEDGATALNATIISDAYSGGGVAPFEVKPSCVWRYKDGVYCTYSGDNPTCDLTFEGANGCVVHFGFDMARARYGGGAKDLDETAKAEFGPLRGGGGFTGSGPGCFFPGTPIFAGGDYRELPIENFKAGDSIRSVNRDTFEDADDAALHDVFRHSYRNWYHLVFSDGSELSVTETHPFFPRPGERVVVRDFQLGMYFRRLVPGRGWRTVQLISMSPRKSYDLIDFFNVPVEANQSYFANGFPVSNNKAPIDAEIPYSRDGGYGIMY